MKNFKSFINEAGPNAKPKAKGEADFVDAHKVEITDPEDSATEGPAKVTTKEGSGKRKADRLDNKQAMGEEVEEIDEVRNPLDHGWKSSKEPGVMTRQKLGDSPSKGHREYKIKHAGQTVQFKVPFTQDKTHGLSHHLSKIDHEGIRKHLTKLHGPTGRKSSEGFGADHSDIVSGAKQWMGKNSVKEEVELDEEQLIEMDKSELPFTPDKPKKNPPAKAGKYGQGPSTAKHLAKIGMKKAAEKKTQKEEVEESIKPELEKHFPASGVRKHAPYTNPGLEKLAQQKKTLRTMKKSMKEADFSKKQTTMAHTIGKEFEKKGVGDETKGGPYAVASAMVRDKPEAAKKAYATIKSKMKEEADAELLFKLYDDLNEENQEFFMHQLEEDAEALLDFAKMLEE